MREVIEVALKSSGILSVNTGAVGSSAVRICGQAFDNTKKPHVLSGGAAVPATRLMNQGRAYDVNGSLYMTDSAVGSGATTICGVSIRADGAVHCNSGAVSSGAITVAGARIASGRLHESGL